MTVHCIFTHRLESKNNKTVHPNPLPLTQNVPQFAHNKTET